VVARLRAEKGFGLLELLMAMTLLNIGILAIVAAFNSGAVALRRAGQLSTASTLADQQMELYRGLTYASISLDSASATTALAEANYKCDKAVLVDPTLACSSGNTSTEVTATCAGVPDQCNPMRTLTGPDNHRYRVDTYIILTCPTTSTGCSGASPTARNVKLVTVVVRDALDLTKVLAREASTFDSSTG
jgi:Tfp pilus assembly protein PilV